MNRYTRHALSGAVVLLATAFGLAACGGGSDSSGQTAPRPLASSTAEPSQTTTTAAATTPTKAAERAKRHRSARTTKAKPKPRVNDRVLVRVNGKTRVKRVRIVTKLDPRLSKAAPMACLKRSDIDKPRVQARGIWMGTVDGEPLTVDGPYKSTSAAAKSVTTLAGASIAESAGRWVVSAAVSSHLEEPVHRVALCLGNGVVTHRVAADLNPE